VRLNTRPHAVLTTTVDSRINAVGCEVLIDVRENDDCALGSSAWILPRHHNSVHVRQAGL
jgi:hypothetical protein